MKQIDIYTDGACSGNPGPGGAAAVIVIPHHDTIRIAQGYILTTNNRMELQAIALALRNVLEDLPETLELGDTVTIYTDSQIAYGALALGWRRKANTDIWNAIDNLADAVETITGNPVSYDKVKGHANNEWNNLADRLAVLARTAGDRIEDTGYSGMSSPSRPDPNLFPEKITLPLDDVRECLRQAAVDNAESTYAILASMFVNHELSLEKLAAYLSRYL